jgi:hypothetical protein
MAQLVGYLGRLATSDQGTVGFLHFPWADYLVLELPWRNNLSNVSCIPEGRYHVKWTRSPRFKRFMYEVQAVPSRGGIRIHSGSFAGDVAKGYKTHSHGCPLIGRRLSNIGQLTLTGSKLRTSEFELALNKRPWILEVENVFNRKSA